jgi:hypothetical protein
MDVATIITLVLSAVTIFFGGKWLLVKGKLGQVKALGEESLDVIVAVVDALEDDKITDEEIETIKEEALEVADAWATLMSKE